LIPPHSFSEQGCPPLVWSSSTPSQPNAIRLSGTRCLSILHANNGYDTSAGIVVEVQDPSQLALYKGLSTSTSHLMNSGSSYQYPNFIYGQYVVISYNLPQSNMVNYSWNKRGGCSKPSALNHREMKVHTGG
ncbi:hypothetical protein ANCCAN_09021, partial [Ancylostoma caninum]